VDIKTIENDRTIIIIKPEITPEVLIFSMRSHL
jgi:hypothetical protein